MRTRVPDQQKRGYPEEPVCRKHDIVDLLRADPGRFTLGELIQQREAALNEIIDLRKKCRQWPTDPTIRAEALGGSGANSELTAPALRPGMLVSAKELKSILGVGHSTIYKMVAEGRFPRQTRIGPRASRWRSDDVIEWLGRLR